MDCIQTSTYVQDWWPPYSINDNIITMKRLNLCVWGCADLYITATNYTYDQYTQRVRISKLKNDIESILRDESKNKRRKQYEA